MSDTTWDDQTTWDSGEAYDGYGAIYGIPAYLTGTFFPPNSTSDHWAQADFNTEFADMAAVGITTVILQLSLSEDFNSAEYPAPWPSTNPVNSVAPPASPALADAGSGTLAPGTYGYRITEANTTAGETTPSPETTITLASLAAPAAPTVTPTGTAGTTTWQYKITALSAYGETTGSSAGQTTTGNATLSITNYNLVTWTAVTGATSYNVYRYNGTAYVYIANVSGGTAMGDTGLTPTTTHPPTSNTTAPTSVTVTGVLSSPSNHLRVYGRTTGGELFEHALAAGVLSWTDTGSTTPAGALPTTNTAFPPYSMTNNYTAIMLGSANTYGCQVWLGLANVSAWFNHATDSDGGAAWFTAQLPVFEQVATELYALYGTNPAFVGWYIPFEIGSYVLSFSAAQTPMRNFFSALINYLHTKFPGLPVMVSPTPLGYGGVGPLAPATWASGLLNVIPGVDVINSQDVAGTLDLPTALTYITALNTAIATMSGTKPAQWSNPDMFDNTTGTTMAPAKLQSHLIAEAPYVAKFTGFSFWSQMGPHDLATSYYYDSYRDYLLGPNNWVFSYNGLTFGVGTNIEVSAIAGLGDVAAVRNSDQVRPNAYGMVGGYDYLGVRSIVMTLEVTPDSSGSLSLALDEVKEAFAPTTDPANIKPFLFKLPGQDRRLINARARKLSAPIDLGYTGGIAIVNVQLDAIDPRIYESVQSFTNILCTGGTATVVNAGNCPTLPVAAIAGPCGGPTITNNNTGQSISLTAGAGFGQVFVVDFDAHTVEYQGTSMYSLLTPGNQFWSLAPGATQVAFSTIGAIPPVTWGLTLTWRSAWY